ncbi:hypothetical protein GCM10022251_25280 [Phytohabitans flavus]|uniref:PPE family domain-containing protein n=1 Tax=Phytohabitans flavus TaxID=1076124 RepID=A0A6F8XR93_9ACTN|nr:hypothetical protein [Phytohabitans flavus]BCB76268.1 hypothetical protein Pflav_026780 [Phytohabitans flavus]
MADKTMADEFYERYRHLSHQELFTQLQAGSPRQVEKVIGAWRAAEEAAEAVATTLGRDLGALSLTWNSVAGREFQYRLGLISAYARKLADEASAIRTGLAVMSTALRQAQRQAEPEQADVVVGPASGVVGPAFGHTMVEEERAKSRERLAVLVANLATEYVLTDHGAWPRSVPAPPPDLPAGVGLPPALTLPPATELAGATTLDTAPRPAPLPGGGGGLAAAGIGSGGGGPVLDLSPTTAAASAPAHTLGGVLSGVSGGGRGTTENVRPEARGGGSSAATAPMAPMGGVPPAGAIGAAPVGRTPDGYVVNDPRYADDAASWSNVDNVEWDDGASPPPSVIGDPRTTA